MKALDIYYDYRKRIWDVINYIGYSGHFVHGGIIKVIGENGEEIHLPEIVTLLTLNAIVPRGTALLYGGYGAGKTSLARILGRLMTGLSLSDIDQSIVRSHPHLTEEKMIGRLHVGDLLKEGKERIIWRKFVETFWKIIDEVNRLNPQLQDVVLSLLGEGIVKYFDEVYSVNNYVLYATVNPSDVGSYELGLPFLDRFGIAIPFSNPNITELYEIAGLKDEKLYLLNDENVPSFLDIDDLITIWGIVENMPVSNEAKLFTSVLARELTLCIRVQKETGVFLIRGNNICEECKYFNEESLCHLVFTPLSVRATKDLLRYSKALSWLIGLKEVTASTVATIAPYVIWHRIVFSKSILNKYGENAFLTAKDIVQRAFNRFINRLPFQKMLIDFYYSGKIDGVSLAELKSKSGSDIVIEMDMLPQVEELFYNDEAKQLISKIREKIESGKIGEVFELIKQGEQFLPPHLQQRISRLTIERVKDRGKLLVVTSEEWVRVVKEVMDILNLRNVEVDDLIKPNISLEFWDKEYYVNISTTSMKENAPVYIKINAVDEIINQVHDLFK